jgi:spore coat protein CotH
MRCYLLKSTIGIFLLLAFIANINAQNEGNALFGYNQIHDIRFNFWQNNYWDSLTQNYTADQYMPCHMTVNGVAYDSIGIKFKGNSSYNNPSDKKSFKVDMNEYISGQKIDGLKKFNLNNGFKDPTFMREKLFLDFLRENNIPAPRCTYAKVYINNTYWGLYMMVEEVNKKFLEQRFGNDTENLFKGDPSGDLKWLGSNPSLYYPKYELHTNETANNWTDLVAFINGLNNSSPSVFYDSLNYYLNVTAYLKAWASSNIFANLDSYMGSGHNYYIYHNAINNKFEWITWDVNEAFGGFQMGMNVTQLENLSMYFLPNPPGNRPLNQKILMNQTLKNQYTSIMCDLVLNKVDTAKMNQKIDSIANVIRSAVYSDTKKFFSNQQFENNMNQNINVPNNPGAPVIPGLKSFYKARKDFLTNELSQNNCIASVSKINDEELVQIFPVPASDYFYLSNIKEDGEIQLFDVNGKLMLSQKTNSGTKQLIDIRSIPSGIYFYSITQSNEKPIRGKMIKN